MEIFKRCSELLEQGKNLVLVTVLNASQGTPGKEGFKMILTDREELLGTVGGGAVEHQAVEEAREVLRVRENRLKSYNLDDLGMKCGGQVTLLYEYFEGLRSFLLVGGGHIGRALSPILESLGFRVTVFDSRPEVHELLGENSTRKIVTGDYRDLAPVQEILKNCQFCFIATHGHEHDYTVLKQLVQSRQPFRYVGLIGSTRKIHTTLEKLKEDGLEAPQCLYAPVGLKIGGDSPAEIAVSIAAEVVALLNGAEVPHMRGEMASRRTDEPSGG
jgi:xanthine dehydrogenase accessory factor